PTQYGNGNQVKVVHHDYDQASRLSALTVGGQSYASSIVYNAASQTTSMRVGQAGANQIIETYGYVAATGLLDSQTIARDSAPTTYLLNLSYDYAGSNGKRTGQLKKILNNLNHNKDRSYSYDALRRLTEAKGGPSGSLWTQTYVFDRYGNRTSVTASGFSAQNERPVGPTRTDLLAKNTFEPPAIPGDDTKAVSDSPLTLFPVKTNAAATAPFQSGPPTFTNDPLTTGTDIKAIHVTELRDAINLLRLRAGLTTVTWAEAVSTGVLIKATHITEMRTRLEQARTALSLAATVYTDPNLASGYVIKKEHIQEIRDSLKAAWNVSSAISRDGHASLSYEATSNRITTSGFAYDAAGNQVRALIPGGTGSQRYQYDAANRLANVKTDDSSTVLASYTYGHSTARLIETVGTSRTYFVSNDDGIAVAEFTESGASVDPGWSKSYIYVGRRLLSTLTPNGSGGEAVEYHHPDRLGTRLITTPSGSSSENVTLPFGTVLTGESTATTNRRFTSYDRSGASKLDYAVNRHYDSQQGRFTQVDPAGMKATKLEAPQTLNLYAYCANDPINHTDPTGLGFISFLKKLFRIVLMVAVVAALVVISVVAPFVIGGLFGTIVSWTAFIGAAIVAGQLAAEFIGHINQWLHRCRVPDFAGLSAGRQDELRQRGVTPEQWDGLKNKARLAYFNIVAAITSVGLSLAGWLVDWSEGKGIQQDRVFFIAGPGATNLSQQVAASSSFSPDINKGRDHPGYEDSSRQNVFFRSLQLSFSPEGNRLDADLDTFNPNWNGGGPVGFVLHGLSVFSNKVSHFFGAGGKTNPYNVAYRSSWECK
ncbi:MAG TPA: RHS repeat-associated core domain-containing protein, partial [Pyrinomonadaceae bacterium]